MAAAEEAKEEEVDLKQEVMDKVEQHYFAKARKGLILSPAELRDYCKQQDIKPCPSLEQLRKLRHRFKYIGMHSRWRKPPQYVGSTIEKLGVIFVDVGEFMKSLAPFNKQRYILLVATDLLSQKLACIAYPNKSQQSWQHGLDQMIRHEFPAVHTIVSDRDTSISGSAFQARIKSEYGVDWIHLRTR